MRTKFRVLIVDDNPTIREILQKVLSETYEVIIAENGSLAIEKLSQKSFDIIITDYLMPGLTGKELLQKLQLKSEKPPVLVMTGINDPRVRAEFYEYGAVGFIAKPFTAEEIKNAVHNLLAAFGRQEKLLEEAKRNFATVVSHELRTPLVAISAGSEVLLRELENSPLFNIANSIKKSGQRLEKLISNFALFQQIQLGVAEKIASEKKMLTTFESCLNRSFRILYDEINELLPCFIFKGVYFSKGFVANEHQVSTAITKIIENCLKFGKSKPVVILETRLNDQTVSLRLISSNTRFPENYTEQQIQPFYQPDRKTLEQQGTGLGLYIAKSLIEINNGKLKIYNNHGAVSELSFNAVKTLT
ncbi:MAG: hybrid sensor histidine kinase/response regulator [Deltaproteobacteria bacterium]|nr:hybrid sensor histidine kinase/response regulator [Deltaproteobacteria bacterium]